MSSFPKLDPNDRRLNVIGRNGDFVEGAGSPAMLKIAFTELRPKPSWNSAMDTQLMFGEKLQVYEQENEWSLVQAERDRYVGWLETKALEFDVLESSHKVCAPRTFFYPAPDIKLAHKGMRSMGSEVTIVDEVDNNGTHFSITHTGMAIFSKHICPMDEYEEDYVAVAERLLATPYLWGGSTAFGIDCSGLVKLTLFMSGKKVLRDSDMQAATIGSPIDPGAKLEHVRRGDLVFWKGHVGICQGPNGEGEHMLIHANAHSMDVTSEPLSDAITRIAYLYGEPIGFRRP